ncbi:hypothetical protein ACLOJK_016241 [Asimina triloba]
MDTQATRIPSSLTCELSIVSAKNIDFLPPGTLFVRYYLMGKNGKRIRLNSREIPSTCDPCWEERVVLACNSTADPRNELGRQTVVFELRWRVKAPVLVGRIVGSKLLGRVEIPWKDALEAKDMVMNKWATLTTTGCVSVGLKPPALQLMMKVRVPEIVEKPKLRKAAGSTRWEECGCSDGSCRSGEDHDIFALAACASLEVM